MLTVTVLGRGGVPASGVSAVVFNLTAVQPVTNGYLSAYPAGQPTPPTSSLNFAAGETRAHLVVVAPGSAGQVTLLNGSAGTVDLLADAVGYYNGGAPTAGGEFGALTPARILDTRSGLGDPQSDPGPGISFQVTGRGGVPSAGVSTVMLNLTATRASRNGYLSASPNGAASSSVNFQAGRSASNLVVVPVDAIGAINVRPSVDRVDIVADVVGYFAGGSPAAAGRLGGVDPARLLDTRVTHAAIPAFATVAVAVAGRDRVPSDAITAAALNVTVASPTAAGYLTTYPTGTARPTTSTVSFSHTTLANLVLAPLGSDGSVQIYNGSASPVEVVVDVSAFVGPIPGPLTWSARTSIPVQSAITEVSCGSATFCMAFDQDTTYRYDGHSWSAASVLSVGTASCVAGNFCMGLTATGPSEFDGTTWLTTGFPDAGAGLDSVSCTSPTFCVVLDAGYPAASSWVFDGSRWTKIVVGTDLSSNTYVSCVSPTFCLAVDYYGGDSARFDGTSWTSLGKIGAAGMSAVSCTSVSFCVAAGNGTAVIFDGTRWGPPTTLDIRTSTSDSLSSLSCTSASFCLAATDAGYQLMWNGTSWTTAFEVDPASVNYLIVSCAEPAFCIVADPSGVVVGS